MSRQSWPLLIALCLWHLAPARAADTPVAVAPQQGVVLLRNGQVLAGKITQAGDDYYVSLASGEIRLSIQQVDLVCRDLAEGYERKRGRIDADKPADHLDLALWCMHHGLYEAAEKEIAEARDLSPRYPRIPLVERQLQLAREQPENPDHKSAATGAIPSAEDLDRLVRGMPSGTVETFTNTIQPLLLNTCATAGCHGPQAEGKLRLLRTPSSKMFSRRFTQRNLHSVMETIDRVDPAASPLLTAPVTQHGTAKAAIFTTKHAGQYQQLSQWVMRVARGPAPEQPATVDTPDDHLSQQLPRAGLPHREPMTPNPLFLAPTDGEQSPATGKTLRMPTQKDKVLDKSTRKAAALLAAPTTDGAGDPFDPDIFNRQFHPPQ